MKDLYFGCKKENAKNSNGRNYFLKSMIGGFSERFLFIKGEKFVVF